MAEVSEIKAPEGQQMSFTSTADVMNKFAENLSKKKEQAKTEIPKDEPKITDEQKTLPEETKIAEIKSETPKEPSSNGQPENPKKELETTIAPLPEIKPEVKEDDWRKELGFDDNANPKTEENKVPEKDFKAEYEQTAKELSEISNDPFIAAYSAAKKAGKDVSSFINEVRGVDVNALSPEQIWDANLKAEGLSPEDIATEMEKFSELSPFEKRQKVKTFKQELITQQHDNLKKYASETSGAVKDKQALVELAQQQGKQFFEKIKDKEWQGIKMTPSEVGKLENFLEKEFKFINADGTLNYELYAKVGNYALNERTILQNTYKKGETKGYEKALLEFSRPSSNDKRFNSAPDVKTKNKSQEAKEAAKAAFNPS